MTEIKPGFVWRRVYVFSAVAFAVFASSVYLYSSVATPFFLSVGLSYVLMPAVQFLADRGLPRYVAVTLLLVLFLTFIAALVVAFLPFIRTQLGELFAVLPDALEALRSHWIPKFSEAVSRLGLAPQGQLPEAFEVEHISERLVSGANEALGSLWHSAPGVLNNVVNVILTLLLTFVILKDLPYLRSRLRYYLPVDLRPGLGEVLLKVDLVLRSVIRGQLLVATILMGLYVLGFSLIGLNAAVAIGVAAGACRVVPYLDVVVGALLSALLLFSEGAPSSDFAFVALVIIAVQLTDGIFVTPRVLGERAGLHPVFVLVSLVALGNFFGFWGILFAIPGIAATKVVLVEARRQLLSSSVYCQGYFLDTSEEKSKDTCPAAGQS